jgi:hypothetical protein
MDTALTVLIYVIAAWGALWVLVGILMILLGLSVAWWCR